METTAGNSGGSPVTSERILQFGFGYAAPLMLEAAVRLLVFDALDGGARTIEEVSAASGASVRGVRILLNGLTGLEFLSKDAKGHYHLKPDTAAFLVSTKPGYLGGFIRHTSTQLIPRWLELPDVVRTGKPKQGVNQPQVGTAFFQEFVEDLFPINHPAAHFLADTLKIGAARHPVQVLDLAAGSGVWGIGLAQKSPQVRVTAVDWPDVLAVTRRVVARHGLTERFQFVAGDLAEADFGTGRQLAILGHILQSEGEERSRQLLRKTFAALAPGGTIAIAEWLVNDDRTGPPGGVIFAVNMLVNTDQGDTFSFKEISGWLTEAGFREPRTADGPGFSPLILASKP